MELLQAFYVCPTFHIYGSVHNETDMNYEEAVYHVTQDLLPKDQLNVLFEPHTCLNELRQFKCFW